MNFDLNRSILEPLFASQGFQQARLVAFDYDGVVAHTEHQQMHAFMWAAETLHNLSDGVTGRRKEFGLNFEEFVDEFLGMPERKILATLIDRYKITLDMEDLLEQRAHTFLSGAFHSLGPNPYALAIVEHAVAMGKHCIVLSNGRSNVLGALNDHWSIADRFHEMQTVDVRPIENKIEYLQSLGVPPGEIVLIEDSHKAVQGAHDAGMHTVYVQHDLNARYGFVPASGLTIPCVQSPPLSRERAQHSIWKLQEQAAASRLRLVANS